jgi:hypothetical protein
MSWLTVSAPERSSDIQNMLIGGTYCPEFGAVGADSSAEQRAAMLPVRSPSGPLHHRGAAKGTTSTCL